ncbi:MAG: 1-acyl-sn-glycerol-3-phosphate acyltransferase [Clostridia bacterium]|nr:1-acyl-sn-glycerol-3-phosphate acyltransferase [Clostridia bacterium]
MSRPEAPQVPAVPSAEERRALNKKNARGVLYTIFRAIVYFPVCFFHNLHFHGRENEPRRGDGSYLVICNHLTWRDPIFLCAALKQQQPHFMAKKELFKIPLLRGLISKLGAYPVDRQGVDIGAIKSTIRMLRTGTPVGMFPQGHRYNGEDPRTTPIRSGCAMMALKGGVPVLPVYIKVKDNTVKAFRRKDIIIGKPIMPEELGYDPEAPGEYNRVAALLYEKVCALGDEHHE